MCNDRAMNHHELKQFIGERIRFYRKKGKLTQKQLASQISISYQQLQNYEYGEIAPSALTISEVAKILGVNTGCFFPSYVKTDEERQILENLIESKNRIEELAREILQESKKIDKYKKIKCR